MSFRPEFLNRLDETVFFKPLQKKQVGAIVRLLSKDLISRLQDKQLKFSLTDEAVDFIVEKGYDAVYGARPLKRYMQHALETTIARYILSGELNVGDELICDVENEKLVVKKS